MRQVQQGLLVQPARRLLLQAQLDLQGRQAHRGSRVQLDLLDRPARKALPVLRGRQVQLALKALLVRLAQRVQLDRKALPDPQGLLAQPGQHLT